jgi:hypothetical protein
MMYSVMSITNAIKVRRAAMKLRNDAIRTSVIFDERENRRAIKVAPVAAVRNENVSVIRKKWWSRPDGELGTCQMDAQLGHE